MKNISLEQRNYPLAGTITMVGDKSISHRAIIFAALANGTTRITNLLESEDCFRTIKVFQELGVSIKKRDTMYVIKSNGIAGLKKPKKPLYFGNSGTTARLMIGLLSGLPFDSKVYGDPSLTKRPMDRVIYPLKKMGAVIFEKHDDMCLPLTIQGMQLNSIEYTVPVRSAQVKSSLLLAGLLANSETRITELAMTRDHTEIMLDAFGGFVKKEDNTIVVTPITSLTGRDVHIPGDISSAAFWIVGTLIVPKSAIRLQNVGLNKTRTGILDVLKKMGVKFSLENVTETAGEKNGTLLIKHQPVSSTIIEGDLIPRLIDEIPIIALLATQADGTTIIRNAEELRVKETDRIKAVVNILSTLGADIKATEDGMVIKGKTELTGGKVSAYGDHRMAMMIIIASLISKKKTIIDDVSSIAISYPNFFEDLRRLTNETTNDLETK